ncbi:MAG TPA: uroporphyrinogen decarboxylase [Gemmatimonadaceae bacterium]|nr:uroporphyrinogen decarboxylase [Gemmatimonadaceae bacterium]
MSLEETCFMRAARRQPVPRTPVWFMRQAGRVLPEYRAVRERLSLLEITQRPEVCAEVTLQPVRRFGVDAAILFADIMHPLIGAGVALEIVDGVGPIIAAPVRAPAGVEAIGALEPARDLPYVLETIRILKRELGARLPLIGFAGAPFTLAAYLVEGRGTRDFAHTKALMYGAPAVWHALMEKLTGMVVSYLQAQRLAGADALQLFDSWVGCLSPRDYRTYVQPYTRRIFAELAPAGAPLVHFGVNTATLLPEMRDDGATVIGIDWRIGLDDAWGIVGPERAVQGNLDPAVLLAPAAVIQREVRDVLARAQGRPGHIFNLGHGLLPQTPVEAVAQVIETVRSCTPEPRTMDAREPMLATARGGR